MSGRGWPSPRPLNPGRELEGGGVAWTEERGTSDEGRRRLKAPRKRTGNGVSIDGFRTLRATCLLAPNPSPMTLDGTNTWLIAEPGSPSALVVDPGPDDEDHLRRVVDLLAGAGDPRRPVPGPRPARTAIRAQIGRAHV